MVPEKLGTRNGAIYLGGMVSPYRLGHLFIARRIPTCFRTIASPLLCEAEDWGVRMCYKELDRMDYVGEVALLSRDLR
jgi:hypothetical protein